MNNTITYSAHGITGPHSPTKLNFALEEESSLTGDSCLRQLFQELNRLRMTGILCDCILTTTDGGGTFRVHKVVMALCSDYFRALFTTSLVDKLCGDGQNQRKIYRIPNISSASLESIIHFAYRDIVHINEDNVNELLPAADQFNVKCIVNECIDFLLRNMTAENCIGICRLGKEYFIPDLEKEAKRFVLEHFVEIVNTEEFLQLKVDFLKDILEDNGLNVPGEFLVWIAIKRWCMHKYMKRLKYIPELFPNVRLALLSINQFQQIMDDPRVFRHKECRTYINIASKYILNDLQNLPKDVEDNKAVSMFIPRYPNEVVLSSGGWTIGGPTNVFEVYDSQADLWKVISAEDFEPRAYHQTLCLGDHIYILGGSTGQTQLNSCWRSDITNLRFEKISSMHERRAFLSATILNGKIYAIGGFNGYERLKTAEFYDEEHNQWIYISSMNERRSDASASSLRDRIFVVGGYNGLNFLQSAECYFSEFDQWFYMSLMVKCRSGVGCVAMDDAVYAIGGYDGENRLNTVEKYCFFQSQWFAFKPMKQRRSNFALAVLEKKIYVMGGYDDASDDTTDQAECFDPANPEWRSIASLNVGRSGLSACTFSGITRIRPYIKDDRLRCRLKNNSTEDNVVSYRNEDHGIRSALQIEQNMFV